MSYGRFSTIVDGSDCGSRILINLFHLIQFHFYVHFLDNYMFCFLSTLRSNEFHFFILQFKLDYNTSFYCNKKIKIFVPAHRNNFP